MDLDVKCINNEEEKPFHASPRHIVPVHAIPFYRLEDVQKMWVKQTGDNR